MKIIIISMLYSNNFLGRSAIRFFTTSYDLQKQLYQEP